ncbi:MAG TPA: HD domain-containing protein [Candidatus Binatus sp.]|nr:HD domain-containing protein [Candidatus Binatus sp.]
MTVPSREEAARLLRSLDPPDWHARHARAVAEIAGWLALRIERRRLGDRSSSARGRRRGPVGERLPIVDRRIVEAAALLHDVDKAIGVGRADRDPGGPPRRGLADPGRAPHGEAGARWLTAQGHPELGEAVSLHPVTLLVEREGVDRVLGAAIEARIVAYADKRAGQRLESMASRFDGWRRRQPHSRAGGGWSVEQADRAWAAALALEANVCALAGCAPEVVRRLRWTSGLGWTPGLGTRPGLAATCGLGRTPRLGGRSTRRGGPGRLPAPPTAAGVPG